MRSPALGLAVQDAAEIALKDRNLDVVVDHHGHDFTVTAPAPESALEDASDRFEVGPFFVEVKATRSGRARLTPTQAEMASARQSSYVLCVVDLTGVDETRLKGHGRRPMWNPSLRSSPTLAAGSTRRAARP
jgi:hypothetical protein